MSNLYARLQRLHAERRARERFGIEMTDRIYRGLIRNIKKGRKVRFIHARADGRSLWRVRIMGMVAIAVYDHEHNTIVTLMKPGSPQQKTAS